MRKVLLVILALFMLSSVTMAATQRFEADGTYRMGETDTIVSAKQEAKNLALRSAAESAGIYIQAYSKAQNSVLTEDEVKTIAAKIIRVKSCDYRQEYKENTLIVHAHVVATIDDKNIKAANAKEILSLKDQLANEKLINQNIKQAQIKHGAKDPEAESVIWTTSAYLENGDYSRALWKADNYISQHKNTVPAHLWYLHSVAQFSKGKYNEALSDIGKAIKLDGKNPRYYVQEALIRLGVSDKYQQWGQKSEAKNQYFLAEQKCYTALSFRSRYYPALHCRSMARYLNDNLRKSVNDAENAVTHGGRGVSYVENFSDYIHARYNGRHKRLPKEDLIPMLQDAVIGLMEIKEKKR